MGTIKKQDPSLMEVRKHVAVVHSSGALPFLSRKAFNVLLLQSYDELLTRREHEIPRAALVELAGFNSNDTAHLLKALQALQTTIVEYNVLEDKLSGPGLDSQTLVAHIGMRKGVIKFSFIEPMAELLSNPEIFASINIGVQNRFSGGFALALYENCVRYRKIGQTGEIPVDKLRLLLGATSKNYDLFKRFRERVIMPALNEVNRCADIELTYVPRTGSGRGSPVTAVKFLVKPNRQRTLVPFESADMAKLKGHATYQQLISLGLSERLAASTIAEDPAFAARVVAATSAAVNAGRVKKSSAAYAAGLIKKRPPDLLEARKPDATMAVASDAPKGPAPDPLLAQPDEVVEELYRVAVERLGQDRLETFRHQYLSGLKKGRHADRAAWNEERGVWIGAWAEHRFRIALIRHVESVTSSPLSGTD